MASPRRKTTSSPQPGRSHLSDVPKIQPAAGGDIRTPSPGEGAGALDPRFRKNYRRRIQPADEEGFRWQDPMPSSNPARPRTLEAGYSAGERTLRVVFRDGTPWEYYGVEPIVWQRFKRSASPGRFINRVLNQYPYARGEFDPPGR